MFIQTPATPSFEDAYDYFQENQSSKNRIRLQYKIVIFDILYDDNWNNMTQFVMLFSRVMSHTWFR